MRKFLQKLKQPRIFLPIIVLCLVGFWPHFASADDGILANTAVYIVGKLVQYYVTAIGWIVAQLISLLILIAQYNDFVTSRAITEGWVIVRDVVNMFFIVILLVIAFATIFNIEEYKYQKLLPRLLIMAIVINFSRTIAGIFIDLGQVIMLTFVNGFQAAAGGNFLNALKINDLLKFNQNAIIEGKKDINIGYVFVGYILAAIMISVTLVVIVVMLFILIMRIVTLWFLVVLSPLAFLASVWPSGRIKQKYSQWWDMFLDNIMVGPILAFFLWLSLLVLGQGDFGSTLKANGVPVVWGNVASVGVSAAGDPQSMISYLMGIGMLLGSLYMAQSMRSAGSGIAGSALGKIQGFAKNTVNKGAMLPVRGAKLAAGAAAGAAWEKSGGRAYKDAIVSNIQSSKFGKAVGLGTKADKENTKIMKDSQVLRSLGQTTKANKLISKLAIARQREISEESLPFDKLKDNYKQAAKGSPEREAYAREIASRGMITKNTDFKQYSEGNRNLENSLREASFRAGNKEAKVGFQQDLSKPADPKADLQKLYDITYTTPQAKQKMYSDIEQADFVPERLSILQKSDFEKFSPVIQEKVKNAFASVAANSPKTFKDLDLENKFKEIKNTSDQTVKNSGTRNIDLESGPDIDINITPPITPNTPKTPPPPPAPKTPPTAPSSSGSVPPITPNAPKTPSTPPKTPPPPPAPKTPPTAPKSPSFDVSDEGVEDVEADDDWMSSLKDSGLK